ncbi:hypothetical protein ACQEVC_13710 [Plantactinospora sp. CA-294935]|uniref:hypothetical protein n=1 Tax=Plantactinospora sp. CA-294935 TaxID=3240012 RepID=UPI003D8BF47C
MQSTEGTSYDNDGFSFERKDIRIMTHIRRTLIVLTATITAALSIFAGPASAESQPAHRVVGAPQANCEFLDFTQPDVPMHQKPKLDAPVVGHGSPGDCFLPFWAAAGDPVWCPEYDKYLDDWYEGWNVRTGQYGFVNFCFI